MSAFALRFRNVPELLAIIFSYRIYVRSPGG
jgi:hypothetical protein